MILLVAGYKTGSKKCNNLQPGSNTYGIKRAIYIYLIYVPGFICYRHKIFCSDLAGTFKENQSIPHIYRAIRRGQNTSNANLTFLFFLSPFAHKGSYYINYCSAQFQFSSLIYFWFCLFFCAWSNFRLTKIIKHSSVI